MRFCRLSAVTCLALASLCVAGQRFAAAQDAADPAAVAKSDAAQKAADEAIAKRQVVEKSVAEVQAALKTAAQNLAKAKADEAKINGEITAAEKTLTEKQAALKKASDDLAAPAKELADAQAASKTATDAKAAADKIVADLSVISKATADTAAAAKTAVEKAPGDKGIALLKVLADQVAADAAKPVAEAQAKAAEVEKTVVAAAATLKAATEKHAAAMKVVTDADAAVKAVEKTIADSKANLAKAQEVSKNAETAHAAAAAEVQKAETVLAAATKEVETALKASEEALAAIGRFVSFSKQVAPIFNKRCLACHNAQTAKGRYNMDSYLGIVKGGEQGDTVIPKDADGSNLVALLEDGSMPKDADPLTKDEIALVKQWIANGARLDVGVKADAQLATIIPKLPQPPAPEAYRLPIPVTALAWNADGSLLASSGYHEIILWNGADGQLVRRIGNVAERTYDLEFSANGALLAVAAGTPGQMGEVKLFNPADGTLVKDLMTTNDSVFAVAFSPDGKRLATCSADRSIRVFNLESYAQELLIEDHADWVMDIAWSPDGAKLASASRDKTSKLFDAKTGESIVTFPGHNEVVYGVSFAPDGNQVLTSGRDNRIRAWNPADAKQIREISGIGGEVYRVVVTADGRVFSCSSDKQAREHAVADGKAVRQFQGHNDWIYSLSFNPATKKLATGSWDGEIRLWNADDAKGQLTFVAAPGYTPPTATAAAK
jgi:hypothetical protein